MSVPTSSAEATDPLYIDVRSPGEFQRGWLEGAINLPLDQLLQGIGRVAGDPDRELILYCASGARSAAACSALQQLGYRRVRNGGGLGVLAATTQRRVCC